MARVREGNQQVLLVVDVQVGVVKDAWDRTSILHNIATAVERARSAAVPVIWVQHSNDELPQHSAQWQWVTELAPASDETQIHKKYNSAFESTSLSDELARLGASHIVLAGAASNWCIRATAYGALDRGYDLTLLRDAHTTDSMQIDGGITIDAAQVVQELNIAMKWLEYPGVKNGTALAAEMAFA